MRGFLQLLYFFVLKKSFRADEVRDNGIDVVYAVFTQCCAASVFPDRHVFS